MGINDFRKHQCLRHNNPGDPSLLPELPSQGENTHPLLAPELMHILMETKSLLIWNQILILESSFQKGKEELERYCCEIKTNLGTLMTYCIHHHPHVCHIFLMCTVFQLMIRNDASIHALR